MSLCIVTNGFGNGIKILTLQKYVGVFKQLPTIWMVHRSDVNKSWDFSDCWKKWGRKARSRLKMREKNKAFLSMWVVQMQGNRNRGHHLGTKREWRVQSHSQNDRGWKLLGVWYLFCILKLTNHPKNVISHIHVQVFQIDSLQRKLHIILSKEKEMMYTCMYEVIWWYCFLSLLSLGSYYDHLKKDLKLMILW